MIRLLSKSSPVAVAIMAALLLAGCSDDTSESAVEQASVVRPAAIQTISGSAMGSMSFNGVVRSAERAELAFRVPGKLVAMEVKEGDKVQQGQVLAKLE